MLQLLQMLNMGIRVIFHIGCFAADDSANSADSADSGVGVSADSAALNRRCVRLKQDAAALRPYRIGCGWQAADTIYCV
jgi:hypothetical protein